MDFPVNEGYIPFHGFKTWYRRVGSGSTGKLPLLCVHGGPGMTHDYLNTIEALAGSGREVILYDQLGNGNSDQPHDPSLWTVALFVEELGAVRNALGLDQIHLLGSPGAVFWLWNTW